MEADNIKISSGRRGPLITACLLFVIFAVIGAALVTSSVELSSVSWINFPELDYDSLDPSYFDESVLDTADWSNPVDPSLMEPWQTIITIAAIVSVLIIIFAAVIAIRTCGTRGTDGRIRMNPFDRIFSELQLVIGIFVNFMLAPASELYFSWISNSLWFRSLLSGALIEGWTPERFEKACDYFEYRGFLPQSYVPGSTFNPGWLDLLVACLIVALIAAIDIGVIVSLSKKIKNHSFIQSMLFGSIILYIIRQYRKSPYIFPKVIGGLLGIVALSAVSLMRLPVGAAAATVLVFVIAPAQISKYVTVRDGIRAIASGDVGHKIDLKGDGEFERMAAEINSIAAAQQQAIDNGIRDQKLKTELITNVSHDLRTPLTSIISYLDVLKQEGLGSANAAAYLDIISEKADRLQRLTEDLFEAAKAASGDIPVELTRIDLVSMLDQSLAEMEGRLESGGIHVIRGDWPASAPVMADGRLLWRVLENLLVNVSKYAQPGSRAYIDIGQRGGRSLLEIKNVSREQLNISPAELMERFQRGDSARNTEGTGLGLSIASDLTSLMGGSFRIGIDGDLFKAMVELPEAPAAPETDTPAAAAGPGDRAAAPRTQS